MLIPLLLAIFCFSSTIALSGQFVNTATQQNSFNAILRFLVTTIPLAAVTLKKKESLKKFNSSGFTGHLEIVGVVMLLTYES